MEIKHILVSTHVFEKGSSQFLQASEIRSANSPTGSIYRASLNDALTVRAVSGSVWSRLSMHVKRGTVAFGGPKASKWTNERSFYAFQWAGTASPR